MALLQPAPPPRQVARFLAGPPRSGGTLEEARHAPGLQAARLSRVKRLQEGGGQVSASPADRRETTMEWNRLRILQKSNWKIKGPNGAAERLGVKPTTLRSRMGEWGLKSRRLPDARFFGCSSFRPVGV